MRFPILVAFVLILQVPLYAQNPVDPQAQIAAVKESLQKSIAILKQHEWIETTNISVDGEIKSTIMKKCYYGAEGKVQKIPVAPTQPQKKNEKLTDYMHQAIGLVDLYVPPDPALIERAKNAGKFSIQVLEPGKRVRFGFSDYIQAGDLLSMDVDLANSHILGMQVSTYIGTPKDPVGMTLGLSTFPDGTIYPAKVTLDATAKKVHVEVQNSGFRKVGS